MIDQGEYKREYTTDFVSHWDELIGWDGRGRSEKDFFRRLLNAHDAHEVIDVASGTGFHAVTLANQGFSVTATDGSDNMLAKTRENARTYDVALAETRVADWLELKQEFGENRFDALVCLGNAFTHLFDHELRRNALAAMYAVLKPGGMICLDHRNYDRILDHGYSTKHMYYYTGNGVDARPVEISNTLTHFEYTFPDGEAFHLKLYPLKQGYVSHLLDDAGFVDNLVYGDFQRPFESNDVDFIQQIAFKPRKAARGPTNGNGKSNGNGAAHNDRNGLN